MIGIDTVAANALGLITTAVDKIWPNPADKARADVEVIKATAEAAIGKMQAEMAVVLAEAKSEHWLAACWRPISMLAMLALVICHSFGLTTLSDNLAELMWDTLRFGLGGYVASRGIEKVVKTVTPAVAALAQRPAKAPTTIINTAGQEQNGNG